MKTHHKIKAAFIALPGAIAIIAGTSVAKSLAAGFIGMLFLLAVLDAVGHFAPRDFLGRKRPGPVGLLVGICAAGAGVLLPCIYASGVFS